MPVQHPSARALVSYTTLLAAVLWAGGAPRGAAVFTALPVQPAAPASNPLTPDKVALGRLLFWDPILSGGKDVACATCHHPSSGYSDGRDLPIGAHGTGLGVNRRFPVGNTMPFVKRNSPTVLNAAFNGIDTAGSYDPLQAPMFWDMRVRSLESQSLEPIKALEEMRGDGYSSAEILPVVVARVAEIGEYREAFARAFGGSRPVTSENLAKALASFERSLVAANSPFDRYMRGEADAMTPAQIAGMAQFERSGCANCHNGPMFSDYTLHVLGVPDSVRLTAPDTGANGVYAFRTPSLRNLSYTAPYMHSGVFPTLDAVLNFYNAVSGGRGRGPGGGPGFGPRGGRGPGGPGGGPGPGGPGPGGQPPAGPGGVAQAVAPQQGPGRPGGPPPFGRGGRGGRGPVLNANVSRADLDPLLRQVDVRAGRADLLQFLGALNDGSFDRTVPARVPSGLTPGGS